MLWSLPFYLQLQHYIKLLVCTEPVVGIEFPLNIYLLAWFWPLVYLCHVWLWKPSRFILNWNIRGIGAEVKQDAIRKK
jgi:hypothetical protein